MIVCPYQNVFLRSSKVDHFEKYYLNAFQIFIF